MAPDPSLCRTTAMADSAFMVSATSIASWPRRSSFVTTMASPGSIRSRSRANCGRSRAETLPEIVSVMTRCCTMLNPDPSISLSWFSTVWPVVDTRA